MGSGQSLGNIIVNPVLTCSGKFTVGVGGLQMTKDDDLTANEWSCVMYEVWGLMRGELQDNELIQSWPSWSCKGKCILIQFILYTRIFFLICNLVNMFNFNIVQTSTSLPLTLYFSRCNYNIFTILQLHSYLHCIGALYLTLYISSPHPVIQLILSCP